MPRQMPRYGIPRSRATRQARIFPSQPREPKPPGTSTPSTCSRSCVASSTDIPSASPQRTCTVAPISAGKDLSLPAAGAEATGDEHAVDLLEELRRFLDRHPFGVDPAHLHRCAVVCACVLERLVHREVGVLQLHVLPDERDLDDLVTPLDALVQIEPVAEVRFRRRQAELLADEPVEAFGLQP